MRPFRLEKCLFEKRGQGTVVQVFQRGDRRELRFGNRVVQSAMSLSDPEALLLEYTRAMMIGFAFRPEAESVLHLGLGGGSMARFIHAYLPAVRQKAVEPIPEVIEAAFGHFQLAISPRLAVVQSDGAAYLAETSDRFHLILQDAFLADGAARHMQTPEFLRMVRDRLEPGGWYVNNAWGSDPVNLGVVASNMGSLFPSLYSLAARSESNVILIAGNSRFSPSWRSLLESARQLAIRVPLDFPGLVGRLVQGWPGTPPPPTPSR